MNKTIENLTGEQLKVRFVEIMSKNINLDKEFKGLEKELSSTYSDILNERIESKSKKHIGQTRNIIKARFEELNEKMNESFNTALANDGYRELLKAYIAKRGSKPASKQEEDNEFKKIIKKILGWKGFK